MSSDSPRAIFAVELQRNTPAAVDDVVRKCYEVNEGMDPLEQKKAYAVEYCRQRYMGLIHTSLRNAVGETESRKVFRGFRFSNKEEKRIESTIHKICTASSELDKKEIAKTFQQLNEKIAGDYSKQLRSLGDAVNATDPETHWGVAVALGVVFLTVVVTLLYKQWQGGSSSNWGFTDGRSNCIKQAEVKLTKMKDRYTTQSEQFWKVMTKIGIPHSCSRSTFEVAPLRIVTVTTAKVQRRMNDCVVKDLSAVLSDNHVTIDLSAYTSSDVNTAKEQLHDAIQGHLIQGNRLFIMKNIDTLHFEIAKLFFKFCDNENTEYPDAMYIFSLNLAATLEEKVGSTVIEQRAMSHLEDMWRAYDRGQVRALVARITDITIEVFDETQLLESGLC